MMITVDKYSATEMFEFNALSQLHYFYTTVDGHVIYAKARAFKAKARHPNAKAKKFGLKTKD